jgi:hypothetical protein
VCTWSSPAVDLVYVLYAIASKQVRLNHRDELLLFYYENFTNTLKSIGYMNKIPTLHSLHMEMLRCGFLEVLISTCFLPFFQFDFSNTPPEVDMQRMLDPAYGIDFRQMVYELPEYTDDMMKLLPQFMHKGFLD